MTNLVQCLLVRKREGKLNKTGKKSHMTCKGVKCYLYSVIDVSLTLESIW